MLDMLFSRADMVYSVCVINCKTCNYGILHESFFVYVVYISWNCAYNISQYSWKEETAKVKYVYTGQYLWWTNNIRR